MGAIHGCFVVPVDDSVEDVEWQPADSEGHDDGEQHDVDALCLMAAVLVLTHSLHHALPLPQTDIDLRVKATEKRQGESGTMREREKVKIYRIILIMYQIVLKKKKLIKIFVLCFMILVLICW